MPRDFAKYLWDMDRAGTDISDFVEGHTLQTYKDHSMLRAAVERKFEVIGEALAQVAIHHPAMLSSLPDSGRFIGFRNVLIHRYAEIVDDLVWSVIQTSLPSLRARVSALLSSLERSGY